MTGFGRATKQLDKKKVTIEVTSLNGKNFDINVRSPHIGRETELVLRNILSEKLERGKAELNISIELDEALSGYSINKEIVKKYHGDLLALSGDLNIAPDDLLSVIMRLPNVTSQESDELSETDLEAIKETVKEAGDDVIKFRTDEGSKLEKDIVERVRRIMNLLSEIQKLDEERIKSIKARIQNNLETFISKDKIDENRFEQEVIYYLEKIDVTEEKVRLKSHCDYFLETLPDKKVAKGKKLNFIAQEMGREINTIGSKAGDAPIQRLVVQMKDDLEKIKEQLLNVL
jgi:uncharacterized protein (TIGR00255 family)